MMPCLIRHAEPSDAAHIVSTINAVGAENVWLATENYTPTPLWELALHEPERDSRVLLLVAQEQEQIVGWCRVFPYSFGLKSQHVADLGIGVLKAHRRRGIGRDLMTHALDWARTRGYEKLTLDLYASNQAALHLFERAGFYQIGVRYHHAKWNGEYVDEILMEKSI